MKRALLPGLAMLLALLPAGARAQEPVIGLAAPLSGPSSILGEQVAAGAGAAAGADVRVLAADTECSAAGGAGAAEVFVEAEVSVVVGFLCTAAIEAALPILTAASIPVIDVGVRANRLTDRRERTGHLVWRIAPRSDAEAQAVAQFVSDNWRDVPFAIVEDGSAYGRDLADEVRARLGPQSIEPALVDNYRPAEEVQFSLARRIAQSGVNRLLVFGARADVAILARDAAEIGLELDIVGGESLLDAPAPGTDLPQGVRALAPFDDPTLVPDPLSSTGAPVEGYFLPAYVATQVALQAMGAASDKDALAVALGLNRFDTVLGAFRFDENGESGLDRFEVLTWDGQRFVPAPPA